MSRAAKSSGSLNTEDRFGDFAHRAALADHVREFDVGQHDMSATKALEFASLLRFKFARHDLVAIAPDPRFAGFD